MKKVNMILVGIATLLLVQIVCTSNIISHFDKSVTETSKPTVSWENIQKGTKRLRYAEIFGQRNGNTVLLDEDGNMYEYHFNDIPEEDEKIRIWVNDNNTPDNISDDIIFNVEIK